MRTTTSRNSSTASEDYKNLVWLLLTYHITTFPTITTAKDHQEIKKIPCILFLHTWNSEEPWRHPWKDAITARSCIFYLWCTSSHLFISFLNLLPYKTGDCKRRRHVVFLWNESFSFSGEFAVFMVFHSLSHISHSEFYLPIYSPSLLSLSSISSQEANRRYLRSFGESKGINFTSTSRYSSSLPLSWLIVQLLYL